MQSVPTTRMKPVLTLTFLQKLTLSYFYGSLLRNGDGKIGANVEPQQQAIRDCLCSLLEIQLAAMNLIFATLRSSELIRCPRV